jgi:hypothetical protein
MQLKISQLFILVFLITKSMVLAQEKKVSKSSDFKFLGMDCYYEKYEDGTKSWACDINEEEKQVSPKKSSNYSGDLVTDLGINLWNPKDRTPAVKPWGSWNVEVKYLSKYRASRNFHLNTSLGVNWFNFKLEDRDLIAVRTPSGLSWEEFTDGKGTKSKISTSYANLTFIPTLVSTNGKLSLGAGVYGGFRLGGRGKFVYEDTAGEPKKKFDKANMYANDFRYGVRTEIGVGDVKLFLTYDLNEFFLPGKGPEVQAISFGVSLR